MIEFTVRIYGDDAAARQVIEDLERTRDQTGLDFEIRPVIQKPDPRSRKRQAARNFLLSAFEGAGPNEGQSGEHLISLAGEHGIREGTLYAAKADLRMRSQPRGPGKTTLWMPPGSKKDKDEIERDEDGVPIL